MIISRSKCRPENNSLTLFISSPITPICNSLQQPLYPRRTRYLHQSLFKPLPMDARRDLTTSLLTAWLDKNLQYPITEYLPVGMPPRSYSPSRTYSDISGGKAWESAK